MFRFTELQPGTYKVNLKAKGFKSYAEKEIVLVGSETRDLGSIQLQVGSATEEVTVNAEITPVQLASSENSATIDTDTVKEQAIRGRDMVALMDFVPGLVDNLSSSSGGAGNATGREVTSSQALQGITINGADLGHINYTVDGVPALDTTLQYLHYEPNIDSIQELKVMTSDYQAEFGRNSGASITVITKGGGKQFHGSGWYSHRHEQFEANTWANDYTDAAKSPDRSNVAGWSLGGPVYIPGKFNTAKNKLFFFASQEYTRQLVPNSNPPGYATFPSSDVVNGDFSNITLFQGGSWNPVPIYYPDASSPSGRSVIPGCEATRIPTADTCIITSYMNPSGQKLLSWDNSTADLSKYGVNPTPTNQDNWYSSGTSGSHPRRNDMIRIDVNPKSNVSGYFRWIRDTDTQVKHNMQSTQDVWPIFSTNPGHGYAGNVTWTISPTMVNELTIGKDWNEWGWNAMDPSSAASSLVDLPLSYTINFNTSVNGYQSVMPNHTYGSSGGGPGGGGPGGGGPGGPPPGGGGPGGGGGGGGSCTTTPCNTPNFHPFLWDIADAQNIWTVTDNLSKTLGAHNVKVGIYVEKQNRAQAGVQQYNGSYGFGTSGTAPNANSLDAGDGFANAYMGHFASFSQSNGRTVGDVNYWNVEWYAQDNWRVNRRLTLDAGVRFYHLSPYTDNNKEEAYFDPDKYNPGSVPTFTTDDTLHCSATDLTSNCSVFSVANGATVYDNGMVRVGTNGVPLNTYYTKWLTITPRLGFALDLFGNGKTAVRGGFGMFANRETGQTFIGSSGGTMAGQAPVLGSVSLGWNTFDSLSGAASPIGPSTLYNWEKKSGNTQALNGSFGVQQNLGHNLVLDLSYVGAWTQNSPISVNTNTVPLWSCFSTPQGSPDAGQYHPNATFNCKSSGAQTVNQLYDTHRQYQGYEAIYMTDFVGRNNYQSLQATLQRRFSNGVMLGAAYTLSKQLSLGTIDPLLSPADNLQRNYGGGPAGSNLMINWAYSVPSLSKKLGDSAGLKVLGAVTDNWSLSGITHVASGGAIAVSCGFANGVNYDQTGTSDEAARCDLVGNPHQKSGKLIFNPAAYTVAAAGTLGNAPNNTNILGPGQQNWDAAVRKSFPLGGDSRRKLRIEATASNVFNHPQFTGVSSSLTFAQTPNGWSDGATQFSSTGKPNTGVGAYSSSTYPPRILGFDARIEF
jgi:hypothetical protein